jgi:hypothetical protein
MGDARGALILLAASHTAAAETSSRQSARNEEAVDRLRELIEKQLEEGAYRKAWRLGETTPLERLLEVVGEGSPPG